MRHGGFSFSFALVTQVLVTAFLLVCVARRFRRRVLHLRSPKMGGKDVVKRIRRINKDNKPHEPVYDPELLPAGSIISVDVSTLLVPFVKSNEGSAQLTAIPLQSVTSVQDKLELIYLKKIVFGACQCHAI